MMLNKKVCIMKNKIEAEYNSIDENMAEIQKRLTQIASSTELIRYLKYLKSNFKDESIF